MKNKIHQEKELLLKRIQNLEKEAEELRYTKLIYLKSEKKE